MWTHGQQGKSMNRDAPRQSAVLSRWGLRALDGLKCVPKDPRPHRKWQARKLIGSVIHQQPTKNDKSASEGFSRAQKSFAKFAIIQNGKADNSGRAGPQINERTGIEGVDSISAGKLKCPSRIRGRDLWLANPSCARRKLTRAVAREALTAGSAMSFRR